MITDLTGLDSIRGRILRVKQEVFETIGCLYAEHVSRMHGWVSFSAYLNGALPLPKLLAAQTGMLARGPRPLIEAYRAVLEGSGHRCNVLSGEPAVGNSVEGPYGLILGSSYVVASAFEAEILGESAAL